MRFFQLGWKLINGFVFTELFLSLVTADAMKIPRGFRGCWSSYRYGLVQFLGHFFGVAFFFLLRLYEVMLPTLTEVMHMVALGSGAVGRSCCRATLKVHMHLISRGVLIFYLLPAT